MPENNEQEANLPLGEALEQLAGVLLGDVALEAVLELVVSLAVECLTWVDGGSVSMAGSGPAQTFAGSSAMICQIDAVQYETDRGPCLTAIREKRIVVASFHESNEWPEVAAAGLERGFERVLSLPLGESPVVGSLNLYGRGYEAITDNQLAAGRQFARRASTVVSNATKVATADLINRQLQEALLNRDVIGQAKGVLRERFGYGDQEAFDDLRRGSQRERLKLRDIAQNVIDSTKRGAVR